MTIPGFDIFGRDRIRGLLGLEQLPISAKLGIVLRNTRLDHRNFFCWI